MKPNEANEMAARLSGLLPKMTDQQMLTVAEKLEKFPRGVGYKAVTSYAETNLEFLLPKFLMALRVAGAEVNGKASKPKEFRYIDVLKQGLRMREPQYNFQGISDIDFMIDVGRRWLADRALVKRDSAAVKAKIKRVVTQTLMHECGLSEGEAGAASEMCFEDLVPEMT